MSVVGEVLQAAIAAVGGEGRWLLGLFVASVLLLMSERLLGRLGPTGQRIVRVVALLAAAAAAIRLAWKVRFLCDDAFISFRYARNFAHGHGLVWNPGSWVEGYTNFLWTLLLGLLGALHLEIPLVALALGLLSLAAALWATALSVRRIGPVKQVVPFAALALACSTPFTTFGTSGLETMFAAALVIVAVAEGVRSEARAGLWLTLATLTRPDHALVLGAYGLALVVEDLLMGQGPLWRRLQVGRYLRFAAPFVLLFVPYFLWRWRAYSDLLPNTYYAKSGGLSYYSQGFVWLSDFFGSSGAWLWVPVGVASLFGRFRSRQEVRLRVFAFTASALFTAYVVRVGGDFMEWRFFVPMMPVVAALLEVRLRYLASGARPVFRLAWALAAAASVAAAVLPIHLVKPWEKKWMLSWEASFYRVKTLFPLHIVSVYDDMGHKLAASLTDHGVEPPLALDSIGIVGWFSRLPMVDAFGLTNRAIGHKAIAGRGRPGHEKMASPDELVDQGAVLSMVHLLDPGFETMTQVTVNGFEFHFLRLDPKWAAAVAAVPGAVVPDPLHDAVTMARTFPREKVLEAQRFFHRFLKGNPLERRVQAVLQDRLQAVADFEDGLPPDAQVTGKALAVRTGVAPSGATGSGWLSSANEPGTGRVDIPIAVLPGSELRFGLSGPASPLLSVTLVVDGKVARSASPTGSEGLGPVSFSLGDLQGRSAILRIEDADPSPAVGLSVDAIHFPPDREDIRARIASATAASLLQLLEEAESELPPGDPDRQALESRMLLHWNLDALPEGTYVVGTAFGPGPEAGSLPDQQRVAGYDGRYLTSFHGHDASTGRVELPEMALPAGSIAVRVGGGSDCTKTYVGVEIPGKGVVARACGRNDEVLRTASLDTRAYAGERGRVVIVDDSAGAWGHILADDVVAVGPYSSTPTALPRNRISGAMRPQVSR